MISRFLLPAAQTRILLLSLCEINSDSHGFFYLPYSSYVQCFEFFLLIGEIKEFIHKSRGTSIDFISAFVFGQILICAQEFYF